MKKMMTLAAAATVALSSCSLLGNPNNPDVSGKLTGGFPADGSVRLALAGRSLNNFTTVDSSPTQIVDAKILNGYTLDLPSNLAAGDYTVIAFLDANKDGKYNVGETIVSDDGGKRLVFKTANDASYRQGWNIRRADGTVQNQPLTGYDLTYKSN
ncbi:hypothetical protein [Deinococcus maricopensis]|uniref:Lipoprotein n=1 Tax=Deinococcus maricopensis (strain DSM 21211 / LMG 22137 / NRRL B-23946 / LB-34) TaxID=709986 RepID=E8U593_DEIML|nr:hypothetical protein [Deinococcus maricopensis]ADV66232.1 conserved hypothetical protein, precursor [Deinococcus maricopensis DSM 21211]